MGTQEHWDSIYREKTADEVSWYRPHLERSLHFIQGAGLDREAAILDVGGGTSTLVDDLIELGYKNVTVLDLSANAIEKAKERLGARAGMASWVVGDILKMELPEHGVDFWHDRAVFHFLNDGADRRRYVDVVRRVLKPGGHIVVATFGPAGPEKCSGLPVVRYSADGIHKQFGEEFTRVGSDSEVHLTPWGREQEFVYCYCRMFE
jgi:ubiquinone/menaquinone biosynthesis C-methylase UbiE